MEVCTSVVAAERIRLMRWTDGDENEQNQDIFERGTDLQMD